MIFSGLTAISTYFLTKELWSPGAGLFAASFIAIVPGYISRSVAGSYDNEGKYDLFVFLSNYRPFLPRTAHYRPFLSNYFIRIQFYFKYVKNRHCHLRPPIHLLPLGKIGQKRLRFLVRPGRFILFLHGVSLGWLRFHHQFDPVACVCVAVDEPLFTSSVYQLHHILHFGLIVFDANSIRWFPTNSHE